MKKVIVTDGRSRASLAIVRSLGKKNISITCGEEFDSPAFYSKYCSSKFIYPSPNNSPSYCLESLLKEVKLNHYDTIIPVRDDVTLLLSKNKSIFEEYLDIVVSDYASLLVGRDKSKTIKFAIDNNIPCPKTYFPSNRDSLFEMESSLEYPLIVKPYTGSGSRGINVINNFAELVSIYEESCRKYGPLMLQEFIPYGGAFGVSMLLNRGEPRAVFTHKRLREYPRSGGPSTLRESASYPEIEEYAMKMLKKLNWHGVAMTEFRIDARTNEPKLMEINPRFWGSLQLAVYSGVDFPYLLYEIATKGDVDPVFDYELGKKVRWLFPGDILWFLSSPNKLKALPDFLKFRGMGYDTFSYSDPLPVLGSAIYSLKSTLRKESRKHVFERGW